jgi:hypothetical protein
MTYVTGAPTAVVVPTVDLFTVMGTWQLLITYVAGAPTAVAVPTVDLFTVMRTWQLLMTYVTGAATAVAVPTGWIIHCTTASLFAAYDSWS